MQLSPHCIVPRVSSCVFYSNLHWEKSRGESRLFPINFSPILKHTGVKPSLVSRLYPHTQTASGRQRLQDGIWLTGSARCHLPDTVCQTPRLPDNLAEGGRRPSARLSGRRGICQTPSARPGVCQTLAEGRLADSVWQTASARCHLPDGPMPD